jgi:hypothetical protein
MAGSSVQGKDPGGSSEIGDELLPVILTKGPQTCEEEGKVSAIK